MPFSRTCTSFVVTLLVSTAAALALVAPSPPVQAQDGATTAKAGVNEQRRALGAFDAVQLTSAIDVVLVQSGQSAVTVVGTAQAIDRITTEVRGNTLHVGEKAGNERRWFWNSNAPTVRLVLEVAQLRKLSVAGAGDISTKGLKGEELEVDVLGAGDVRLNGLALSSVKVRIAGSGDVMLAGKAPTQAYVVRGSGDIRASELEGATVSVSIAGSGDARVWATQTLSVSIAGSGDVRYRGEPKLTQQIAGSGDVSKL